MQATQHKTPRGTLRALDLLNFFMADVQTGFGPFVAVYLTAHKWTQVEIGLALTLGTSPVSRARSQRAPSSMP